MLRRLTRPRYPAQQPGCLLLRRARGPGAISRSRPDSSFSSLMTQPFQPRAPGPRLWRRLTSSCGSRRPPTGWWSASQNASVTTGAESADGGNISIITTGSFVHLTDSQITTSVRSGAGTGGNIAIDSKLIVLDESQILARAIGGPGGNINITGDVFLVNSGGTVPTSLNGIVDASSLLSTSGTVDIEATFTNVVGTFAQLPSTPLQATELLRASCAARLSSVK